MDYEPSLGDEDLVVVGDPARLPGFFASLADLLPADSTLDLLHTGRRVPAGPDELRALDEEREHRAEPDRLLPPPPPVRTGRRGRVLPR